MFWHGIFYKSNYGIAIKKYELSELKSSIGGIWDAEMEFIDFYNNS